MDLEDYGDKPLKLQEWLRRKVKTLRTWHLQGRSAHLLDDEHQCTQCPGHPAEPESLESPDQATLASMGLRSGSCFTRALSAQENKDKTSIGRRN